MPNRHFKAIKRNLSSWPNLTLDSKISQITLKLRYRCGWHLVSSKQEIAINNISATVTYFFV